MRMPYVWVRGQDRSPGGCVWVCVRVCVCESVVGWWRDCAPRLCDANCAPADVVVSLVIRGTAVDKREWPLEGKKGFGAEQGEAGGGWKILCSPGWRERKASTNGRRKAGALQVRMGGACRAETSTTVRCYTISLYLSIYTACLLRSM